MRYFFLLSLFVLGSFLSAAQHWGTDSLSTDGRFHNVSSVGDNIYVFRGSQTRGNYYGIELKHMEVINTLSGEHTVLPVADSIIERRFQSPSSQYNVLPAGPYLFYPPELDQPIMDVFNTETNQWTTLKTPMSQLSGAALAANDSLLIFGGGYYGSNMQRKVAVFNRSDSSWVFINFPSRPVGDDMYTYGYTVASTLFIDGNNFFFIGGKAGGYIYDHYRKYDFKIKEWNFNSENNSRPDPFPYISESRYRSLKEQYKNYVLIAGGYVKEETPTSTIEVYNTQTEEWSFIEVPKNFKDKKGKEVVYVQSAIAGNKLFLRANPGGSTVVAAADSIAVYDLERGIWSYLDLPNPRASVSMGTANNKVYFMGGQVVNSPGVNSANQDMSTLKTIDIYTLIPELGVLSAQNDTIQEIALELTQKENAKDTLELKLHNIGDYYLLFNGTTAHLTIEEDISLLQNSLPDSLEAAHEVHIQLLIDRSNEKVINDTLLVYSNSPSKEVYKLPISITVKKEEPNAIFNFVENKELFYIFPNPARSSFSIKMPESVGEGHYELISIDGRKITSGDLNGIETTINSSKLSAGTYLVKITTTNTTFVKTVLIE